MARMAPGFLTLLYELVFLVLIVGVIIYWFWRRSRRSSSVTQAVAPPPVWRRVVRITVTVLAGAFVLIVGLVFLMLLSLGHYARQARTERDKVHIGMTVNQVLPLVHGTPGIRAHAVLPENVSDDAGVHYASLMEHDDGTFGCFDASPDCQSRQLTNAEAVALMTQKMSDGYEWRWRYTFINDTPQHFSFTVTFGRDGRVKDVTDVWGWD